MHWISLMMWISCVTLLCVRACVLNCGQSLKGWWARGEGSIYREDKLVIDFHTYSMGKMPVSYSVAGHQIATIFCTRHDSTARAKFRRHNDIIVSCVRWVNATSECNNNVIMASKRRRRFDVIMTLLLCHVSAGSTPHLSANNNHRKLYLKVNCRFSHLRYFDRIRNSIKKNQKKKRS